MPPRPPSPTRRPVTPTASPRKKPPPMEDRMYAASQNNNQPQPIDLNSSQYSVDKTTGQKGVKRGLFMDVVVERSTDGSLGPETQSLLETLGQPLSYSDLQARPSRRPTSGSSSRSRPTTPSKERDGARPNKVKLQQLVNELKETEERYLRRITVLKRSYADPLRKFAKRPETLIIPLYDAKALFANIDALVLAAEVFAEDLKDVDTSGRMEGKGVGVICLRHLKDLGTFDCYRSYYDKQDESQRSFSNMIKRPPFETFTESVKYQTTGIGNIGIRELLAEPVQRIPRYTLLWQSMLECMGEMDPQRVKLEEAVELASKIALCETDERTRRATIMYCLDRTVEGFPANLMSNNRNFVDCIDVDDIPLDGRERPTSLSSTYSDPSLHDSISGGHQPSPSRNAEASSNGTLHATLFLFDDKLVICKRQSSAISGCKVTGLDDVDKLVKGGGGLPSLMQQGAGLRRDKLSFRGMVDILDVMAADTGDGDFNLFLERPPTDQSDRWSGRQFRYMSVVHPPHPRGMDAIAARTEKERFIRNLWHSQALIKSKPLSALIKRPEAAGCPGAFKTLVGHGGMVPIDGGRDERVVPHASLWDRSAWKSDPRKAKVVIQLEEGISRDPTSLDSINGCPSLLIRIQALPGAICKWQIATSDPEDIPNEEELVHSHMVSEKIMITISASRVYYFTQPTKSPLTTPNSFRHRQSMMNLDTISRNLFGGGSISSRAHSVTSTQRSKSVVSRSSTLDTSRYSMQSRSTAATTVDSEHSVGSPEKTVSVSTKQVTTSSLAMVDEESGGTSDDNVPKIKDRVGQSEMDLDTRLELARQNSTSANQRMRFSFSEPIADSRRDSYVDDSILDIPRTLVIRNRTPTPPEMPAAKSPTVSPVRPLELSRRKSPPPSPSPRKSYGPLSIDTNPSAFAPESLSPRTMPQSHFAMGAYGPSLSEPLAQSTGSAYTKLQVFQGSSSQLHSASGSPERLPGRRVSSGGHKRMHSEEELVPRKKSMDRTPLATRIPADSLGTNERTPRRAGERSPVLIGSRQVSLRNTSGVTASSAGTVTPMRADQPSTNTFSRGDRKLYKTAISAKEHITVAMRTAKSMQAEMSDLMSHMGTELAIKERLSRMADAPSSLSRSPPSRQLSIRAHGSPVKATSGQVPSTPTRHGRRGSRTELDITYMEEWSRGISSLVDQLALDLEHARGLQQAIVTGATELEENQRKTLIEREALTGRFKRANNKFELAQAQLTDLKAELETVYEAFNTELDCLFNDANLPPEEAYIALRTELQQTKADRNQLRLENLKLRTELQEANLRKEEWAKLLKSHGILA